MNAAEIVEQLEQKGFRLRTVGERLRVAPSVPPDLLALLKSERDAGYQLVHTREWTMRGTASLAGLRRFCPGLWTAVHLEDGREGLLWGVTGHGVIFSPSPSAALLTLNPESVAGYVEDAPR